MFQTSVKFVEHTADAKSDNFYACGNVPYDGVNNNIYSIVLPE